MSLQITVALVALTWATGRANIPGKPEANLTDNYIPPITAKHTNHTIEETVEDVMETGELNPNHYPAKRAASVVQHYINARYGSPHKVFIVHRVHGGSVEDVTNSGRRYQLDISIEETISKSIHRCSAEVLFPRGEQQGSPEVRVLCEELEKIDTATDDIALYEKLKTNQTLLSTQNLPDSHGHIEPDMKPLWHLGIVASSSIMLNESTENTLYNVAQIGNVTQLATENDMLKFVYFILLHEMVSQEIIRWKAWINWSPLTECMVVNMEKQPHCHECKNTNTN